LSKRGHSVLLLEEHSEIGRPFQCAGLVNPSAMKSVSLEDTILQEIDGALIHGPSGTLVPVGEDNNPRTFVVCRKRFDQGVVQQSLELGAKIWLNSMPTNATVDDDEVKLTVNNDGNIIDLKCKLLLGCDGAHSWTRRFFKMGKPKELMIGFQAEVVGYQNDNRWLEMYSGSKVAPGFFAWVIPSGFGTHRIGIWSTAEHLQGRSVEQCYHDLLTHPLWAERFSNVKETARYCGPIPCGMVKNPVKNRVMLIGDAAGMAKPTTGGGIGPGFKQIESIIDNLSTAIDSDKLSKKDLHKITSKHWNEMKRSQDKARALRDLLVSNCTDEELDEHFDNFSKPEVLELINSIGDIEKPVPLGMALLKKVPAFRKLALKAGVKLLFT
jgi:geranylgeranyl reductase family protein